MTSRNISVLAILLILLAAGCSYRFVAPFQASDYALVSVGNSSGEAGLTLLLEEEMRKRGGFRKHSANRLSVTVTGFTETVDSVSSSGLPVRQKLSINIAWKVEGTQSTQTVFGKETASQTYPYSTDLSTLDWNRGAAVRLLVETAARLVLEGLGELP